jgi:hypothetical protein
MADSKKILAGSPILSELSSRLSQRCSDPNIAWPYHPRIGVGSTLIDCLLSSLALAAPSFATAIDRGDVLVRRNEVVGGKRRSKRLDLVLSRKDAGTSSVVVEAKACMTAHAKAHSRLVAELTSSLDAILDADPNAAFFSVVAINFGERFTSPLNLPGPNHHEAKDAPNLANALLRSLSNNQEICGTLLLPIRFDNERYCEPFRSELPPTATDENAIMQTLLQRLDIAVG